MQVIHPEYLFACLLFFVLMLIPTRSDYSTRRSRVVSMWPLMVSILGTALVFALAQPYVMNHENVRVPQPVNMVALVDESGSMSQRAASGLPTRAELAVQGLRDFSAGRPDAGFGLTLFGETARIIAPISAGGATLPADATKLSFDYGAGRFDPGFASALEQFRAAGGPEQRVLVLFTDGEGITYFDQPTKIAAELVRLHVDVFLVEVGNAAAKAPAEGQFIRDFVEQLGDSPFTLFQASDTKGVQSALSMIYQQTRGNMMWETKTTRESITGICWIIFGVFFAMIVFLGFGPGSTRVIEMKD